MFRLSFIIFVVSFQKAFFRHQCYVVLFLFLLKCVPHLHLWIWKIESLYWMGNRFSFFFSLSRQTRFQFRCECWWSTKKTNTSNNEGRLIQTRKLLEFCCHCPLYFRCSDRNILYCVIRATGRTNQTKRKKKNQIGMRSSKSFWTMVVLCVVLLYIITISTFAILFEFVLQFFLLSFRTHTETHTQLRFYCLGPFHFFFVSLSFALF